MRTFTKILTVLSAAALITSCVNEEPNYKKNPGENPEPVDPTAVGYVAVNALAMKVVYDGETETMPDDTQSEQSKASVSSTRTNPSVEEFIVEIVDASGVSVAKKTYGEWQEQTEPIELPVGSYTLSARSAESIAEAAWEAPAYSATKEFIVEKDKTTTLDNIVCTLANIKVTMLYSADLEEMLSSDTQAVISLGSKTMTFVKGETRAAYYLPEDVLNTLDFQLTGAFADTGKPVQLSKKIKNVKAGQWRKITLVIEWADKGDITFDIQVDNFVLDDTVDVNGSDGLWEEVIEDNPDVDPASPTISWQDHDISAPFRLTADMFDTEGNCKEPFAFDLVSPNGISSFVVTIGSSNAEFMDALDKVQIPETFDLCTLSPDDPAYSILTGFGFPLGGKVIGKKELTFDIARQMSMLYGFNGTHTFCFTITDANSLTATVTLTLIVDKEHEEQGAKIVWEGYDIDRAQVLDKAMTIVVNVTSQAGIRSFEVDIVSEILRPMLESVGIPEHFDLCTVQGELASTLQSFGFKTGSDVVSPMSFDITQFVEILMMMEPGEHEFVLTVTDDNNVVTKKTLHLINQ